MLKSDSVHSGVESPFAWFRLVAAVVLGSIGTVGMWSMPVVLPAVQADFGVARAPCRGRRLLPAHHDAASRGFGAAPARAGAGGIGWHRCRADAWPRTRCITGPTLRCGLLLLCRDVDAAGSYRRLLRRSRLRR